MNLSKKLLSLACAAAMTAGMAVGCGDKNKDNSEKESDVKDSNFTVSIDDLAEQLGAGWNYGNTLEANSNKIPSETAWGNPVASQEMIDAVAAAGFKTVRIPVSYLSFIDDENGYKVDEAWLDRVQEVVDYCYKNDLFVIINVHGDGYNTIDGGWFLCNGEDQDYIKEKYAALWKQIAEKFADYDEHLIFESMNEEFDGTYSSDPNPDYYSNINDYNQIFIDTVRATGSKNTHRWVMVPGWNTDITYTAGDYGFELPTDENKSTDEGRVIVSVHCYDPWDYCGTENDKTFLWGEKGDEIIEVNGADSRSKASWGNEDHIESQMEKLKTTFVDKGYPVIIGEFGCIDKTLANPGIPNQIAENRAYYDGFFAGTAASYGITPVYWDNGYNGKYGFGLFNRTTCEQTQPELITAIVDAVKNKDPQTARNIDISRYTSASASSASDSSASNSEGGNAYIGIQTKVYTFRNAWSDSNYGKDSEYFQTLIKWGEDSDGDGEDEIIDTGAKFTDAEITGNGTYTVSVSGYDFSSDSDGLNMLFVDTDVPYSTAIKVKDVKLGLDGEDMDISNPVVSEDAQGNLYIELVNIYNTDAPAIEYTMPTDSFSITFTLDGIK